MVLFVGLSIFSGCTFGKNKEELKITNEWFFDELYAEAYVNSDFSVDFTERHAVRFRGDVREYRYEIYNGKGDLDIGSLQVFFGGSAFSDFEIERIEDGHFDLIISTEDIVENFDLYRFDVRYTVNDFVFKRGDDYIFEKIVLDSSRIGGANGVSFVAEFDPAFAIVEGQLIRGGEVDSGLQVLDDRSVLAVGESVDRSDNFIVSVVLDD